ncbi:hypothetical protein [Longimicrobium sp.]|uniref:hypothetical protein n=1 Tax=Longimicrobium sp. TaxID=2029185 RepID=UPI002E2EAA36|nr:hypothetical protein [Longimicrobium sp.]HEX6038904.1 hypothetical protein [Longimicrobium sp.]
MARGGRRPGAGRKPGNNGAEKEELRRLLRERVAVQWGPMIDAQIENAKGIKYLVVREKKTGKFVRVTEAMARAKAKLGDGEEEIEVWEKDPSVQAFTDLANRTIDRPAEQPLDVNVTGEVNLVARLVAGRKRVAEAKHG